MIYLVAVQTLQVLALTLFYFLARPLLRKYAGIGALMIVCVYAFEMMIFKAGMDTSFGESLIVLPWPVPHVTSPVAALDYPDASAAWPSIIKKVWMIGVYAYLALGTIRYIYFRVRVCRASRPAGPRVKAIAREVYREILVYSLTEQKKSEGTTPTDEEMEKAIRRKPPKLLITSAVSSPASIVYYPCRVLLDREDYTDEQLKAILRHEYAHTTDSCQYRLAAFVGTAFGWFNPALWYMRRELRRTEEIACDITATTGYTQAEKREYAELLLKLAVKNREAPGTANVGGGVLRDRLTELYRDQRLRLAGQIAVLILCTALFIGRGTIARPIDYYPASEQSVPAMLGVHESELAYDGLPLRFIHDDLMPFYADYTLFGAIGAYYKANSDGIIHEVSLHYDAAADHEEARAGVSSLETYLTDRLGAPKPARPNDLWYDEAVSWDAVTKTGTPATLTLVIWNDRSHWTDETAGGMLATLYWKERA